MLGTTFFAKYRGRLNHQHKHLDETFLKQIELVVLLPDNPLKYRFYRLKSSANQHPGFRWDLGNDISVCAYEIPYLTWIWESTKLGISGNFGNSHDQPLPQNWEFPIFSRPFFVCKIVTFLEVKNYCQLNIGYKQIWRPFPILQHRNQAPYFISYPIQFDNKLLYMGNLNSKKPGFSRTIFRVRVKIHRLSQRGFTLALWVQNQQKVFAKNCHLNIGTVQSILI